MGGVRSGRSTMCHSLIQRLNQGVLSGFPGGEAGEGSADFHWQDLQGRGGSAAALLEASSVAGSSSSIMRLPRRVSCQGAVWAACAWACAAILSWRVFLCAREGSVSLHHQVPEALFFFFFFFVIQFYVLRTSLCYTICQMSSIYASSRPTLLPVGRN